MEKEMFFKIGRPKASAKTRSKKTRSTCSLGPAPYAYDFSNSD